MPNGVPVVGPGGWFKAPGGGWTSDPAQAVTIPRGEATAEQIEAAAAAIRNIQRIKDSENPTEVFMPEDTTEYATEQDPQAALEAMDEPTRRGYGNFLDLAENAPSESARAFWRGKAKEVLDRHMG